MHCFVFLNKESFEKGVSMFIYFCQVQVCVRPWKRQAFAGVIRCTWPEKRNNTSKIPLVWTHRHRFDKYLKWVWDFTKVSSIYNCQCFFFRVLRTSWRRNRLPFSWRTTDVIAQKQRNTPLQILIYQKNLQVRFYNYCL